MFAGVDAGTKSYRVLWFEKPDNGKFEFLEIPTEKIRKNPKILVELLEEVNADVYSGLSGYGLPVKHFSEIDKWDIKLMTLTLEKEQSVGLRKIINLIAKSELNFYTIPAVIHLDTIPAYRKLFRIDMGTYDKLCTALSVIYNLFNDRIVVVDVGYGYTSFLSIDGGKIVDGFGGTTFLPTYGSSGCIDAEVAYLLGEFKKELIRVGLKDLLGEDAFKVLAENVLKGVKAIEVSIRKAEKVVLAGRFAEKICKTICETIRKPKFEVYYNYKLASAFGAAIISCAIAKKSSKAREVVEKAGIFSAKGTVLDYLPDSFRVVIEKRLKNRKF